MTGYVHPNKTLKADFSVFRSTVELNNGLVFYFKLKVFPILFKKLKKTAINLVFLIFSLIY